MVVQVGHNSKAPTRRGSSDLADSALHHRTVPTKQPSAALKSLVSQPDLDFRRRLELKIDLIGRPAQLPCPVLFLLPRSSWEWDRVGYPLILLIISYCHNQACSHPTPTFPTEPKFPDQTLFLLPGNPGYPIQSFPHFHGNFYASSPAPSLAWP